MRNCCLQFIGWCIGMLLPTEVAQAQCTFDVGAEIEDLETITLQFSIENLLNSDLSNGQGICAVELHFRHSYVGDLTIDLVSPAGQAVQLVGDVTDQISPTNLTTWDVQFLRCGFPASPDAGFAAQWNNNQPWQVFTTYTGSYYPAMGCLEDFNTGSANGIWQLIVTDHDAFQSGQLISVTLIFCDNTGLICNVCGVDAGLFTQTSISLCEGSDLSIVPAFSDTMPDPQFYGYTFLVSPDLVNHAYAEQVNTSVFAPGTYTICGVSYSIADSAALFAQLDTMTFTEIQSVFNNAGLVHCADMTQQCITLEIDQAVDTTFLDQQICAGATVTVGSQMFSTPGTYVVHVDRNGACDSIVVLELDVIFVEARIQQQDTISCLDGITILDGSISTAGPGAMYLWTTQNGNIISPSDQSAIEIDGTGIYVLRVTDQGCVDELSFSVIGDESIPFIAVEGGTLDCNAPAFTFNTIVFPTQVVAVWSGPGGFVSDQLNPVVSNPGSYHLLITDLDGCSASVIVEVVLDTTTIHPQIVTSVDCVNAWTFVSGVPGNLEYQYSWTGPNGFTNQTRQFLTSEPGTYCATLTPPNGCPATTCIDILADYTIPDIQLVASSDTLHCGEQVDLNVSSGTIGPDFSWYGPAGFFSSMSSVSVFESGLYIATVRSPNGCMRSDTVIINQGSDVFDAFGFGDTLNCNVDTALIGVVTFVPGATYSWSGPGLVDSFSAFVGAVVPGIYQVLVSSNTCVQTLSVRVAEDFSEPNFRPFGDTITCLEPVAELSILISSPFEEIHWLLPDGSESVDSLLLTTQEGVHTLMISSANGCVGTRQVFVPIDTLPPPLFAESDSLGCDSVQINVVSADSLIGFNWTGPGGFNSNEFSPFVSEYGSYTLIATGSNGCIGTKVHFVDSSQVRPVFSIIAEDLDCIDSSAVLTLVGIDSTQIFAWFTQGVQISDTAQVVIIDPGQYVGAVTGTNGCTVTDTVEVLAPPIPQVFSQTDTVTCITAALLMATSDIPDIVFFWQDAEGLTGTGPQFSTPNPGLVTIIVTGTNGCTGDTAFIIAADTLSPLAVANSNGMILCDLQSITLDGSASVGQELSYQWSSPNGIINSGANSSSPQITGEGTYILAVTDISNGCTDADTISVEEQQSTLDIVFFTAISECEGNGNASISIDSVSGATTELTYSLNGETGGPLFDFLTSGQYFIEVIDSFGCTLDSVVIISNTSSMSTLSLGEDKSILVGDSVLLEAIVDLDSLQIQSVYWGQIVACDTCLVNFVAPLSTAIYDVFVTDIFGCVASDRVTVFVEEKPKFYIPNVFSPNGDSINDELTVWTHPGIERVTRFSIFDRWGNVVFHATDFVGDGSVRWDGSFGGRKLDPAVFVYLLEVKLLTGRVLTNHGAVSLVK